MSTTDLACTTAPDYRSHSGIGKATALSPAERGVHVLVGGRDAACGDAVVAPIQAEVPAWRDRVRRIADSGYSTLLMPDVPQWQPAPGPTLAFAAALTGLRVGTWVYASPLRPAWNTAWEAHSLSLLTEGRFEMGVGTGRPGIEDELHRLGLPVVPPGQRLAQVRETVTALRNLDGPGLHTPVAMAVRGPKAQALAADVADTSPSR